MRRFVLMLKIIRRQRKLINELREACWEWQAVAGRNEDKFYNAQAEIGRLLAAQTDRDQERKK